MHGAREAPAVGAARVVARVFAHAAITLARDGPTHAVAGLATRRPFPLLSVVAVNAIRTIRVYELLTAHAGPLLCRRADGGSIVADCTRVTQGVVRGITHDAGPDAVGVRQTAPARQAQGVADRGLEDGSRGLTHKAKP